MALYMHTETEVCVLCISNIQAGSQIDDNAVEQCLKYTATVDMIDKLRLTKLKRQHKQLGDFPLILTAETTIKDH